MLLLFEVQPTRSTRVAHNQRWFAFSRCKGAFYLATRNKTQLQSSGLQQTMQGLPTLRVGAQRRGLQPLASSRRWRGRQGLNLPGFWPGRRSYNDPIVGSQLKFAAAEMSSSAALSTSSRLDRARSSTEKTVKALWRV